jgi:hypothetical protein
MGSIATRATTRYQTKKGMISKSYKLDRVTVDMFLEACLNANTTQSKELTKFMKRYIRKHHPYFERYRVHHITGKKNSNKENDRAEEKG